MRDEVVKEAIALRAGDIQHAGSIADAVVSALGLLHVELSLVVGAQAASALFAHALHRTRAKVNWTMPPSIALSEKTFVELRHDLASRAPADTLFAGETLLFALVDHLITLIGEPLTNRMLRSAWSAPDATPTSEEKLQNE